MNNRLNLKSDLFVDAISYHLRSQILTLKEILSSVENTSEIEEEYLRESLKLVGSEINRLRKFVEA